VPEVRSKEYLPSKSDDVPSLVPLTATVAKGSMSLKSPSISLPDKVPFCAKPIKELKNKNVKKNNFEFCIAKI
jgi:hypothetical protein